MLLSITGVVHNYELDKSEILTTHTQTLSELHEVLDHKVYNDHNETRETSEMHEIASHLLQAVRRGKLQQLQLHERSHEVLRYSQC